MTWKVLCGLGAVAGLVLCQGNALAQAFSELPTSESSSVVRLSPDLAELVELTKKSAPESEVLQAVKLCPRPYTLTEQEAAALRRAGVSERVITEVRQHDAQIYKQAQKQPPSVATGTESEPNPRLISPKMSGGSPAAPDTAMRGERPLVRLVAPLALTNPPATDKKTRPWTSSIVVEHAPPPPKLELKTAAPSKDCVWVSGYWIWRDRGWVWQSGYWLKKPAPEAQWMDGYWNRHARGWIWIPGRWM